MTKTSYRTCPNCGHMNLNRDYCEQCGEIVNVLLKRKLDREQKAAEKSAQEPVESPNRLTLFFENASTHKNIVVRSFAKFFYSIWVVVLAIGSFLALVFGYIAA